jgi:hypothetical protein
MRTIPTAKDIRGPSPLIALENEAPAKLIVDPPLPEPLALGRVFISVSDGEPARGASVWQRRPRSVAAHRPYLHNRRRRTVAFCRRQRGNDHPGRPGTWPAQGADRTGRSRAQSDHQETVKFIVPDLRNPESRCCAPTAPSTQ